ncbi:MAG: hypothetical protein DI598_12355 [Pseudopedobacter saltans]|uniref:Heme-binding protein n=1 Tax=Pseudopedobacter saltans TaxID=151895 RepID=A0A2W5EQE5_9SPHI|nr:MAG: hypothetical protein DI598_12355 [Pseudopedobacter saltans]
MDTLKVKTIHEITFAAAEQLLQFGLKEATKKDLKLSIAIVDRAGQLIAFARMDGASIVTVDVAIGKAKTGAYLQAPSKVFEDFINNGAPSMATTPGILPLQGGVPIIYNNEVIGAVGVSGSTGDSDNEMATNIAKAF